MRAEKLRTGGGQVRRQSREARHWGATLASTADQVRTLARHVSSGAGLTWLWCSFFGSGCGGSSTR